MKFTKTKIVILCLLGSIILAIYFVFPSDPIKKQIESMSINEKIGQLLMIGIDGHTVDTNLQNFIEHDHVGGIILTKDNVQDAKQLATLTNEIKQINKTYNQIPIFISVDEEGGSVSRMPPEIMNLPDSKIIGDFHNQELANLVGKAIGQRVSAFGLNMTMAPLLDINSNPRNPVIGNRAFGNTATVVSSMGIAEMKQIQSQNIIPVVKHFPGHGDTDVDSHLGLPVINHDSARLNEMELVPFKAAISKKADMIMVAHILLPKLDKNNPASLSKITISKLLRGKMNFSGVVITDDLTMGAIMKNRDIGVAATQAILAGADIVLVNHDEINKHKVVTALSEAVKSGKISEERIDESVYRILKLKNQYKISDESIKQININQINEASKEIYSIIKAN